MLVFIGTDSPVSVLSVGLRPPVTLWVNCAQRGGLAQIHNSCVSVSPIFDLSLLFCCLRPVSEILDSRGVKLVCWGYVLVVEHLLSMSSSMDFS